MPLVYAHKDRGCTWDIVMQNAAGVTITPSANDKIRAVVGRTSKIESDLTGANLSVSSDGATANGSSFTKNDPNSGTQRLRLDASDLTFPAGVYHMLIELFDHSDAEEWKTVDRYVFVLEDTE